MADLSPRFKARLAGVFYLVTIVMGGIVLFVHGGLGLVVDLLATACYIAMTAFFYDLSR